MGRHHAEPGLATRGRLVVVGEFVLNSRTGCQSGNIVVNFGGDIINGYHGCSPNNDHCRRPNAEFKHNHAGSYHDNGSHF